MKKFVKGIIIVSVLLIVAGISCAVGGLMTGASLADVESLVQEYTPLFKFRYHELFDEDSYEEELFDEELLDEEIFDQKPFEEHHPEDGEHHHSQD